MPAERGGHSLEMLEDGKVLAFGGPTLSAGLYDPSSSTWAPAGERTPSLVSQTSALLGNGKVLFVGGWDGTAFMNSAELWDPLTGSSSTADNLIAPRVVPTATLLADGRVLVIGGYGEVSGSFGPLASAEIYDPSSVTWSGAGEMSTSRVGYTATVLSDGRVLVAGGASVPGGVPDRATEIYDPSTGSWSRAADTIERRERYTATLLKDGRILIASGAGTSGLGGRPPLTSAEVYDPATDTWTPSTEAAR